MFRLIFQSVLSYDLSRRQVLFRKDVSAVKDLVRQAPADTKVTVFRQAGKRGSYRGPHVKWLQVDYLSTGGQAYKGGFDEKANHG